MFRNLWSKVYVQLVFPLLKVSMAPIVLKEFLLQCSIDSFLKCFWLDISWYERFLSEKLEDISVNVGDWALSSSRSLTSFTRNVKSYHPSKISFPGLPSHAEVREIEIYVIIRKCLYAMQIFASSTGGTSCPCVCSCVKHISLLQIWQ